jgi:predicted nucleic acid-binding protein
LLLSPLVLAELDFLVRSRLGVEAARILADDVAAGAYALAPLSATDIADCVAIDRAYGDLGLGLADASLVVLAARAKTRSLLTLDERHFRAVRPSQGGAFRLLPTDR